MATGSTLTGSAVFVSGSESNSLVFDYIPREGETTLANDNGGALQFKLTNGEAIIDLNGGLMHSLRGNKLIYGDDNPGSPLLPKPNDDTEETGEDVKLSLDENKDLIIDGVAPENLSFGVESKAQGGTALVRPPETGFLWGNGIDIYWNSTHTHLSFTVTLPPENGGNYNSLAFDAVSYTHLTLPTNREV